MTRWPVSGSIHSVDWFVVVSARAHSAIAHTPGIKKERNCLDIVMLNMVREFIYPI
jgi:hypothetical protein